MKADDLDTLLHELLAASGGPLTDTERGADRQGRRMVVAGLTLDTGAAVGQAWRDRRRRARLARLLASYSCKVMPLDDRSARAAGQLCGVAGTDDVIDASVLPATSTTCGASTQTSSS